ncbi:unnamed protein product [Parajaminaea phylloscopi]
MSSPDATAATPPSSANGSQASASSAGDPSDDLAKLSLAPAGSPDSASQESNSTLHKIATGGPQHRPAPPPPTQQVRDSSSASSASTPSPSSSSFRNGTGGGGPPPRLGSGGGGPPAVGSGSGGPMNAQERARQMAGVRLPSSLQAKLAANAARSSTGSPARTPQSGQSGGQSPSFMSSHQRLDASSLLARGGPSGTPSLGGGARPGGLGGPPAFPPSTTPGMGGLAARRAGGFPGGVPNLSNLGGGPGGPSAAAPPAGRRNKPGLKLSDIGISTSSEPATEAGGSAAPANRSTAANKAGPPGRLASAPKGGLMSSAFAEFSDVIDPSGRLNFAGKAILHASGVEFGNGTSFQINMEDLELQEVLGKGNYGEVRKVRHTKTGVRMAMKEIRLELDASKLNGIIMELDILHRAVSPEIVEFYGAFFIESCVFYCIEWMDAGSLENLLDGPKSVPEDVLARITKSMVKGLAFLKDELQIMHRDVKPTNVLVNTQGEVKLCDFGVSGQLEKSLAKTNIGCQSYMAPERIKGESLSMPSTYTVASDVWSLGLTIVETTLGVYPYPPETYSNVFAQLQAIVHGDPPQLPADAYSDTARDFVAGCLEKMPERRSTYAQMVRHPWLVLDDERGPEGVDMRGWVARALKRRAEKKEAAREGTPAPS